jgi:hypothetical protein
MEDLKPGDRLIAFNASAFKIKTTFSCDRMTIAVMQDRRPGETEEEFARRCAVVVNIGGNDGKN